MFKVVSKVASALLFVVFSTVVNANLIVMDFTGNNEGVEGTFVFNKEGISLTASAWNINVNSKQDNFTP